MHPARLLRFAFILSLAPLATACAMNPFDGDPGGPPPGPSWQGAYGGEDDSIDDRDFADRRKPRDDSYDDEAAPSPPSTGRAAGTNDYGTSSVQTAELPPPTAGGSTSHDLPPPVDAQRELPLPPPSAMDEPRQPRSGERTLVTSRHKSEPDPAAPPARTVTHTVKSGEELSDIADQYGVREVDIISLNGMKPPYTLKSGQALKIPARATAEAPKGGDYVQAGDTAVVPAPKPRLEGSTPARAAEAASASGPAFDWPVSGKVVAGFGAGQDGLYNEGINIAVPSGTPVRASAGGTVRYAGNELRGYGNLVLIEHGGGYVTAYAHNDVLTVKRGQVVKRGDVIARSGQSGNVKSPQLHFEIRKGTESLDPRTLLVAMN